LFTAPWNYAPIFYFEDRKCHTMLFLDLKGLVLGWSASSKFLHNVLKCKTSEEEKFHDIALIISRKNYVFVRIGFFQRFAKKKYACQGPIFSTCKSYRHCSLSIFTTFANIHHSLSQNWCKTTVETITIPKIHILIVWLLSRCESDSESWIFAKTDQNGPFNMIFCNVFYFK